MFNVSVKVKRRKEFTLLNMTRYDTITLMEAVLAKKLKPSEYKKLLDDSLPAIVYKQVDDDPEKVRLIIRRCDL
jgi:hypothetical protein